MAKKEKITEQELSTLEEKFGKGTIIKASDRQHETVKEWVSTGSLSLDLATSGGIPKGGKCTCILGKEGSSKTTLALHIIAQDQAKGYDACFLDVENTLDLDYAAALGVNLDKLYLIDREYLLKSIGVKDREEIAGEEWLEFLCKVLKSNLYGTVVMDSIAALYPAAEIANGLQGGRLAGVASMMAKAYRAVNAALSSSKSAFVYLNQYRMNPGGYVPMTEPGGEAWKYLQCLKLEIYKSVDKDDDGAYGITVKGKVTKSKVCNPYKAFEYYVEFGKGIIREYEILSAAIDNDLVTKAGAWFYLKGKGKLADQIAKFQGEAAIIKFLKEDKEYTQELEKQLYE